MSITQAPIVVGDFPLESQARRAIDDLTRVGFSKDQIMVAMPVSPSNVLSEELPFQLLMEKISGVQPAWMKLLINADLDNLLDQFD